MHRVAHSTRHIDKFGPGLHGFREKLLAPPVPATVVPAEWLDDVQENIARGITRAGYALEPGNFEQLANAIDRQVDQRATAMALTNWGLLTTVFGGATASAIVAFGSRLIVGCSNGTIHTSDDYGEFWTARTSGTAKQINAFAFNGSIVVAVCDDREIVTSSDGGITWTARTSGVLTATSDIDDVVWDSVNGVFIAMGDVDPTYGLIVTSPDGITWTKQTAHHTGTPVGYARVATGGGKSCALSQGAGTYASFSANGTIWGAAVNPGGIGTHRGVVYNDGRFVILGDNGNGRSATTTDGASFTLGTDLPAGAGSFGAFALSRNGTVYAAASHSLFRSVDGLVWTRVGYTGVGSSTRPVFAFGRAYLPSFTPNQLSRTLSLGAL